MRTSFLILGLGIICLQVMQAKARSASHSMIGKLHHRMKRAVEDGNDAKGAAAVMRRMDADPVLLSRKKRGKADIGITDPDGGRIGVVDPDGGRVGVVDPVDKIGVIDPDE